MVQISLMPCVSEDATEPRWFSIDGCVVAHPEHTEVYVGGTLIGSFDRGDDVQRNLLLVHLSKDRRIKQGTLAWAFGLARQHVWSIRKQVQTEGIESLYGRRKRGREAVLTPRLCRTITKSFDAGQQVGEVHAALMRSKNSADHVSYRSVARVRTEWLAEQPVTSSPERLSRELVAPAMVQVEPRERAGRLCSPGAEEDDGSEELVARPLRGGQHVQHVGGWLLVSMVHSLGLHAAVQQSWQAGQRLQQRLRVALDAFVLALGLGQRCVEGVRRLRTPSGGVLLRADGGLTASWTRRIFKDYLQARQQADRPADLPPGRGQQVQLRMMQLYLEAATAEAREAAVFYVDNHMRPYTGKQTVRKGWRMQDKRARAGTSDYYVHDEDGRPVFRYTAPEHDSLSKWLKPVTRTLREALGKEQRILLAFDRAGAFPEALSSLRDRGFEFVTYERKPYPTLPKSWFTGQLTLDDGEVIGVHEERRKNLGKGRGRVRRIALLMADGHQVNLLAVSEEPAARLVEVMLGRWVQENAFLHGNARWGINQLDGRKTEPYPPQTIVPNPARRRLDRAMTLARNQEGRARNKLARLADDDPRRDKAEQDLEQALLDQKLYTVFRAIAPQKAPLQDTELAGKLVKHKGDYKDLLDTVRIACANAETELALMLAPAMRKPKEAKKALANLFAAPGAVRVNGKSITVTLQPAATAAEARAFDALFKQVNRLGLTLPGDPEARRLRFRCQM